jgi:hypothetical protein
MELARRRLDGDASGPPLLDGDASGPRRSTAL